MAEKGMVVMEEQTKEVKQSTVALIARATKFVVKDPVSLQKSAGILSEIAGAKKQAEEMRKSFTQPLNESLKNINGFFKKLVEPLDKATKIIKGKVSEYYFREEEKARQAEKQRLLAEAKREEELKKAEAEDREPEPEVAIDIPEVKVPEQTVKSVQGKAMTAKHTWKHEIIDPEKVPHEYWIIDESLIREAVRNGARHIDGVRIYEDIDISVRS